MQDYIEKQVKQNTSTMKMTRGMYCQTSNISGTLVGDKISITQMQLEHRLVALL